MKKNRFSIKTLFASVLLSGACMASFAQITDLPVIDGDGSDAVWATAATFTCDSVILDTAITDINDLSGSFKVLWSVDSLYLLINVSDDTLDNTNSGDNQYLNDNVVLYLDAFNKKTHGYVDSTQAFYEIYWDESSSVKGRIGALWTAPGGMNHVNVITDGTGYVAEVAVAWSKFGVNPFAGRIVGLDVKLNDADLDGSRGLLAWNDVSDNGWQYTDIFGNIVLNRDGSVKGVYAGGSTITVDGLGDDDMWVNAEQWDITKLVNNNIGGITDVNDFSGLSKFLWTADTLYAFYSVKDDILYSAAANGYANDNATIAIDLYNKKSGAYVDSSQFYWEIYWYDLIEDGRLGADQLRLYPINYKKVSDEGTGYTLEAAIPFDFALYTPELGNIIGIDVKLNENDGIGRDQLSYYDATDNMWQFPSAFGTAKLGENGKVMAIGTPIKPALTATADSNNITLNWDAVAGAGGTYIISKDGVAMDPISALTYLDADLANATYAYTVQGVSSQGAVSPVSNKKFVVIDVNNGPDAIANATASSFNLYPVPAQNELNISGSEIITNVSIVNVTGQVVYQLNELSATSVKVDVSNLSSGMYFVQINSTVKMFTK